MRMRRLIGAGLTLALFAIAAIAHASDTIVGQQAERHGFKACSPTVDKLAKFLVKDSEYSSHATWGKNKPDVRLFNSQIGIKYKDENSVAVMNVAPTKDGKCDSSYTTIFPMTKSCGVLRETELKDWKFAGDSAGLIVLENASGTSLILLPVGAGCVTVKTEVIHD